MESTIPILIMAGDSVKRLIQIWSGVYQQYLDYLHLSIEFYLYYNALLNIRVKVHVFTLL